MDKQEARQLLTDVLAEYRKIGYAGCVDKLGEIDCREVVGPSGASYQIEVQFMWDGNPGGDVRVMAGIDDGGWRALAPLCDDFIVAPDDSFVGEDGN